MRIHKVRQVLKYYAGHNMNFGISLRKIDMKRTIENVPLNGFR